MSIPHLFRLAREASLMSDYSGNARVGCIAVYRGTVLAKGYNSDKTHTTQARFNMYRFKNCGNKYLPDKMHAETKVLQAIRYLDIDFTKVKIYIYRELRDGKLAMSRCCPSCLAMIKSLGIKTIAYTTDDGYAIEHLKY